MLVSREMFKMSVELFTSPECGIYFPLDVPIPYWMIAMIVFGELGNGSFESRNEFLWIILQVLIALRFETLTIAIFLPLILGKYKTWCKEPEYIWGVLVYMAWVVYASFHVAGQLRNVSEECVSHLEASVKGMT